MYFLFYSSLIVKEFIGKKLSITLNNIMVLDSYSKEPNNKAKAFRLFSLLSMASTFSFYLTHTSPLHLPFNSPWFLSNLLLGILTTCTSHRPLHRPRHKSLDPKV